MAAVQHQADRGLQRAVHQAGMQHVVAVGIGDGRGQAQPRQQLPLAQLDRRERLVCRPVGQTHRRQRLIQLWCFQAALAHLPFQRFHVEPGRSRCRPEQGTALAVHDLPGAAFAVDAEFQRFFGAVRILHQQRDGHVAALAHGQRPQPDHVAQFQMLRIVVAERRLGHGGTGHFQVGDARQHFFHHLLGDTHAMVGQEELATVEA